jgi:membrane-associated phospholipid phosphatase
LYPHWGDVTPFALANPADFLPAGPAPLNSVAYTAQYNEVKAYGALTGSLRTPDQTEIAQFWADGPGTSTPPGHWNAIAQGVLPVGSDLATMTNNARAFAALNVAMADAGIVAWDAKYQTNYWRPITAIREGENDFNGETLGDPSWTPLLTTPPFPEYVSGHSSFSGAGAAILAEVLGTDTVSFTSSSDGLLGVNRSFTTFSSAAEEAGMSRIYGGIHFQQANVDGRLMGAQVADYVLKTQFGAIPEPSGMVLVIISALGLALQRRRRE